MSSSLTAAAAPASSSSSVLSSRSVVTTGGSLLQTNFNASAAQFREIHKNTWLKRLTAEGKKITVGPKKSERSWVVFCVHDDTEALLEGYAEPRQAANHNPEWIISMQDTLHISHALIPNSHEFEFVVTLSNEVVRFHAMSWEIMQEWVETLRSKLREMKILSPRENLYTKLPEIRAPLLPTRDPTSPLPAPPPVPAALVPGVERVVPQSSLQENAAIAVEINQDLTRVTTTNTTTTQTTSNSNVSSCAVTSNAADLTTPSYNAPITTPSLTSMSNTLTQNLLNMLSNPISAYSEHFNDASANNSLVNDADDASLLENDVNLTDFDDAEFLTPLLRKSSVQLMSDTSSVSDNSVRVDICAGKRASADQIRTLDNLMQCDRLIPRPQTSRSLSAGAADKSKKQTGKYLAHHKEMISPQMTSSSNNNITELEISTETVNRTTSTATSVTNTSTTTTTTTAATTTTTTTTTAADPKTNITIIQVSTNNHTVNEADSPPKLPIKSTTGEIFKFPETHTAAATTTNKTKQHEYKSNVQIIPSNANSSTIQVLGQSHVVALANQYSTPVKKSSQSASAIVTSAASSSLSSVAVTAAGAHFEDNKITTVHVAGDGKTTGIPVYGTCYTPLATTSQSSPVLPQKIILPANTCGVTNITVNNSTDAHAIAEIGTSEKGVKHHVGNVHYEKVFLSTSLSAPIQAPAASSSTSATKLVTQWNSPRHQKVGPSSAQATGDGVNLRVPPSLTPATDAKKQRPTTSATPTPTTQLQTPPKGVSNRNKATPTLANHIAGRSPVMQQRRIASPTNLRSTTASSQPPLPMRPPFLTRGLTEAVITTRPSRKDFHFLKLSSTKGKLPTGNNCGNKSTNASVCNNNGELPGTSSSGNTPQHASIAACNRTNAEAVEHRKRSSSTSDAQAQRNTRSTNNNEFLSSRMGGGGGGGGVGGSGSGALRIQQPPQPFRSVENGISSGGLGGGVGGGASPATNTTTSPAAKRMTLREQQVMQLRREIMHSGGVRLQLRRKDCIGSIAWVDAFGAVWVAGWKQKEHPVLYNALHIGDQLLSIAGSTITSAAETNKIIRNSNTLFVEVLVRRIPFGRGYAIRRDREGQCLGLIRDGNTSTIVDVVPNSLAARHGLPPKSQSCDGTTLTFWVLTEINGRPLNLFFKENEIRDRLNSVGRDISILVQPSDLIVKLKKQLKSLRGYKDYLVQ